MELIAGIAVYRGVDQGLSQTGGCDRTDWGQGWVETIGVIVVIVTHGRDPAICGRGRLVAGNLPVGARIHRHLEEDDDGFAWIQGADIDRNGSLGFDSAEAGGEAIRYVSELCG